MKLCIRGTDSETVKVSRKLWAGIFAVHPAAAEPYTRMGTSKKETVHITGALMHLSFQSPHLKIELAIPAGILGVETPLLKSDFTTEPQA